MGARVKFEIISVLVLGLLLALLQTQFANGMEPTDTARSSLHPVSPNNHTTTALYEKGLAYLQSEQMDSAAQYLEITLSTDPEYIPAFINLGRAYIATEQYHKADQVLTHAFSIDSLNSELWRVYGRLMHSEHRNPEARIRPVRGKQPSRPDPIPFMLRSPGGHSSSDR